MAVDPYWSSVKFLFNGELGGLTDASPTPKLMLYPNAANYSTVDKKFGAGSLYMNAGYVYLENTAMTFGSADFTIEAWVNQTDRIAGHGEPLFKADSAGGTFNGGVMLFLSDTAYALRVSNPTIDGYSLDIALSGSLPALGTWNHWAVTRSGSTFTVWLNGASVGSGTYAGAINTPSNESVIGFGGNTITTFTGYVDEFRVTGGVARYTAPFAVPTEGFPTLGPGATLTAPLQTLSATGSPFSERANVSVSCPRPTLIASFGGGSSFTSPSPTFVSNGHNSAGENSFSNSAPSPTLEGFGGANATLSAPSPTLAIAATFTVLGTAVLTAPSPTLSATATGTNVGSGSPYLAAPMATLVGYGGAVCSVTGPMGTLQASSTTGSVGTAAITCPLFELTASGTAQNHGRAELIAPSPRMGVTLQAYLVAPSAQLTAIGSAVVTATYEAYAMNMLQPLDQSPTNQYDAKVQAVTHYTNFPFTHVVRYKNSYFGANSTGLYLLEGTTDAGAPIPFEVKTHETDFGSPEHKTVESAYFAGRIGPAETVTLYAREDTVNAQSFTTPRGAKPQSHRQAFARGLKARYFALGIAGSGEFDLDTVDFSVGTTKRRI